MSRLLSMGLLGDMDSEKSVVGNEGLGERKRTIREN
jgi:hypothetical protein